MSRTTFHFICASVFALSFLATGVYAQSSRDAIHVAGRSVLFLMPNLSGNVTTAIIYEPGDAASEKEARAIARSLSGGMNVGSLTLQPKRVASNGLEQLAGAKVAFVTRGTNYREIASATAARSILTLSLDPACTRAGYCVLAVSSDARVQILVSKAATSAARLKFNSSFLMLIQEI